MLANAVNRPDFPAWIFVVAPPILLVAMSAALSVAGGWHALAKRFREAPETFRISEESHGVKFRCASMEMGPRCFPTHYGNCLVIEVDQNGIQLKVWPIFRILHPPLQIPWSAIDACEMQKAFLIWPYAALYISGVTHPLRFYGRVGKEIYNQWCQWSVPNE